MKEPQIKHTHIFQFRLDADLFEALAEEVQRRNESGEKTSLNKVGQEWMRKGQQVSGQHEHLWSERPQ